MNKIFKEHIKNCATSLNNLATTAVQFMSLKATGFQLHDDLPEGDRVTQCPYILQRLGSLQFYYYYYC
jgi:hypothetical protein